VEDFGKGMLLGMGWVPGQGIGKTNKVLVEPITFISRGSRLGLGADPAALPTKKQKKIHQARRNPRKSSGEGEAWTRWTCSPFQENE